MVKVRTIKQTMEYIKGQDPDTGITENALRRLVLDGEIKYTKIGTKYLLNLDDVEKYFGTENGKK